MLRSSVVAPFLRARRRASPPAPQSVQATREVGRLGLVSLGREAGDERREPLLLGREPGALGSEGEAGAGELLEGLSLHFASEVTGAGSGDGTWKRLTL